MQWIALIAGLLVGGGVAAAAVLRAKGRVLHEKRAAARVEAAKMRKAGELEAAASLHAQSTAAREAGLGLLEATEKELRVRFDALARREERVARREAEVEVTEQSAAPRLEAVQKREREAQSKHDRAKNVRRDLDRLAGEVRQALEQRAGATADELRAQISEAWIEEARAQAAQAVRAVEQSAADPEHARTAKRVMGIAVQRYQGHYLTERLLSNIAIPPGFAEYLTKDDNLMLTAVAEGSGVKLELGETGEKLRIDSGDGVAREVARRALGRLMKGTAPRNVEADPKRWVEQIAQNLDKEIIDLGRKAFSELEIPRPHLDIVKLVGRLNYRTSYTQNQWKHALEAAFIGGMMAAELGLDVKLCRRATLMHDIGKSLSHEIEGSHAVIGADIARRLGEAEVVANAIGAHHADEPPNSVYAYLVAAADAMSGARPGARREQTESYSTRLEDLERIGSSFRGVERAFAVQGGREVRVYVRNETVDDLRAVELSNEIARRISDEMVFPGQIKVTVIRQVEAVEVAN